MLGLASFAAQAQVTPPSWASVQRATGGAGDLNIGRKTVVAADGSQILGGVFEGTMTIGGTTLTAGAGDTHYFLAKFNPNGTLAWAGTADETSGDTDASLAVDPQGNVYIAGYFAGSITFGPLVINGPTDGSTDAFLVKLDPQGVPLWYKTGGISNGDAYVGGVATDAAGNVYVSGDYSGQISFGGGAANQLVSGNSNVFLYKFSATGTPAWARQGGGTNGDFNYDLAADAAGNTYLTGSMRGTAVFGNVTLNTANTDEDIYAVKYNPSGTALWAQRTGSAADDNANTIAVDAAGNVVVGGYANDRQVGTSFESDAFLARFDAQGNPMWTETITPSTGGEYGISGVAFDNRGGLYAIGAFAGTLTLDGNTLTAADETPFIARYDGQGRAIWLNAPTGATVDDQSVFFDVTTDAAGNAYVAGGALGNISFGPIASPGTGIGAFLAKLNAGGTITAARSRTTELALGVYPNPAAERATLQLPQGGGQLTMSDALGRTVRQQALPATAGTHEVSLAGLQPGLYQLRATLGNGQVATARLTVR